MSFAIILGDPHIGKGLNIGKTGIGSNLNSRLVDQISLLDWTFEQAITRNVDNIIVTGDIFEEPKPSFSLIIVFLSWLKKCQSHNINVHLILGNHDLLRSGNVFTSSLDIISEIDLDNVSIYKSINTIFIDSTAFTFLPFRDRKSYHVDSNTNALSLLKDSLVYELAGIPATYNKVAIGHLAIEGSIPIGDEIDDVANELMCPVDMFKGYDGVWMGHVHKPQILHKSNPHVAHIGSMDISNFGETDHNKYIVILDCSSKNLSFFTENLPTRPLKRCTINIPKGVDDTTKYVLQELKKEVFDKSIVKVEVVLSAPELKSINKTFVEKSLIEWGAFHVVSVLESRKIPLIKKDTNSSIAASLNSKTDVSEAIKTFAQLHVDDKLRNRFIEASMEIYNMYRDENKE